MRFLFPVALLAVAACEAPVGVATHSPGYVHSVNGDTVIVRVPATGAPLRLSGASDAQTAQAQGVCSLKGKRAKYISYSLGDVDHLAFSPYDLLFLCV